MLALETISTLYPEPDLVHIHTDGSLLKDTDNAGGGVYSHLFSFYFSTGNCTIVFDGEVAAIRVALSQLYCHLSSFVNAVIFCDSKAAIFSVNSNTTPDSFNILECKKLLLGLFGLSKEIVLQWIPGHCGVAGNELADHLAKQGASIQQTSKKAVPLTNAKRLIKKKMMDLTLNQYTEKNSGKIWWNNLKDLPMWPRRRAVAEFRLTTGHDCLLKHLHRIHVAQAPFCTLCDLQAEMDADQTRLFPALGDISLRDRYWRARDLLGS
ncbi:uncharacterized protein [Parasteatoda tepidariorum]|uniref:uncharacterized protein n=1 Tax=Parasteatoda tepidariorum TaxID=114398 RepID=UPI00077F8226|nr:uncharacterized protein LOC107453399 [Parasteatoda tepidariorum]